MNKNSGYIGWSRSCRAAEAEDKGLLPLSRLGRGLFTRAAAEFLGPTERHHTSKYCNLTDFYNVRKVKALAAQMAKSGLSPDAALTTLRKKQEDRRRSRTHKHQWNDVQTVRETLKKAAELDNHARKCVILLERNGRGWNTRHEDDNIAYNLYSAARLRLEAYELAEKIRQRSR
jgi:hypothetical protein